jgi:hypothetical protein
MTEDAADFARKQKTEENHDEYKTVADETDFVQSHTNYCKTVHNLLFR